MRAFRYALHIYDNGKDADGEHFEYCLRVNYTKKHNILSILFGSCHFSAYFCRR